MNKLAENKLAEIKSPLLQKKNIFDKLKLSGQELSHIGVAWIIFLLALLPQAYLGRFFNLNTESPYFITAATLMAFSFGAAFIFHELGHKFAAQYFKARAEFKLDPRGMLITVVSIALGFYLLMPGAVFWQSNLSKYSNVRGRVSAAGPIVNLQIASISVGLLFFAGSVEGSIGWILYTFGTISFYLNVYLGIFNLIPVWILDGKKIFEWSEIIWFSYLIMFFFLIVGVKVAIPGFVFNFFLFSF